MCHAYCQLTPVTNEGDAFVLIEHDYIISA